MRRKALTGRHWLILVTGLIALLTLGEATGLRARMVAFISPMGRAIGGRPAAWAQERSQLVYENRRLRQELDHMAQLWRHERAAWSRVASLPRQADSAPVSDLLSQWQGQLASLHRSAVAARLIYRDPLPWGSTFWVDVGRDQVKKNSPVVIGNALVGLVDYVGASSSRVRCVTDSDLVVAVRVARGSPQTGALLYQIDQLLALVGQQASGVPDDWKGTLTRLRERLAQPRELAYLAKGEVAGSGIPLWQGLGILKGSGFNYDFADVFGPSRDLRSTCLIESGDLLITSGMDGLFPPGLDVGWVSHLEPLREGAISYEAEVRAAAPQLGHLETVFVLPPLLDEAHAY